MGMAVLSIVRGIALAVCLVPSLVRAADSLGTGVLPPPLPLARSGQVSTFDQAGKIIAFQGSGQDGEFQRGTVWPDPRFIVNGDGTVSDALTGLMWLKDGNCFGDVPWPTAVQLVAAVNQEKKLCHDLKAKHQDWFLPDVNQLASLLDGQVGAQSEALRLAGITEVQNGVYWSSSVYKNRQKAWGVDFAIGTILPHMKIKRHSILLARLEKAEKSMVGKVSASVATSGSERAELLPKTAPRFVEHGDGTVTDTLTGLMWLQDGSCLQTRDWQAAIDTLHALTGGPGDTICPSLLKHYPDWSLPNAIELRSLVDYESDYPALSPGHPFRSLGSGYWTATTVAATPEQAFIVDFDTGAMPAAPKTGKHHVLAVRQVSPSPERPRKESSKGSNLGVDEKYLLGLDREMASEVHWPPAPRFFNNGDGTSMDAITGITWLTDASCLGKNSWGEAGLTLQKFISRPSEFKCEGYESGVDDWQLPTFDEMRDLVNQEEKDGAAWLNQQGVKNVKGGASYWTSNETPFNLYFADAINLKTGKGGNYPKSLKFFVWPKRRQLVEKQQSDPLLNITANSIDSNVILSPQDSLSLVVFLHTFRLRFAADFWFWYDTPDEKRLWLTPIRTWTDKITPVHQGPLFNLKNYEIFRSAENGLAPGVYEFYFAVDRIPNGLLDESRYEAHISVVIPGQ